MEFDDVVKIVDFFSRYLLTPCCFLVILLVQLKIVAALRSEMNLIIFYGKQIEELRKMAAGAGPPRRLQDIPPDETGLYEVLKE
jgi:hypothetical protein